MSDLMIILLPGLDGTGLLFGPFLELLPPYLNVLTIPYPSHLLMNYSELKDYIIERIPANKSFVLLAESFAGPLALEIAAAKAEFVQALVLVATFVENPLSYLGKWTRHLAWIPLFKFPMPRNLIRRYLLGKDASGDQVEHVLHALRMVKPKVFNYRVHLVLHTNAKEALCKCSMPILYLFGAKDKLVTKRSLDVILSLRSDIECILFDAPHLILQKDPVMAREIIDSFLRKHEYGLGKSK